METGGSYEQKLSLSDEQRPHVARLSQANKPSHLPADYVTMHIWSDDRQASSFYMASPELTIIGLAPSEAALVLGWQPRRFAEL